MNNLWGKEMRDMVVENLKENPEARKEMRDQIVRDSSKGNEEADMYHSIMIDQMVEIALLQARIEELEQS